MTSKALTGSTDPLQLRLEQVFAGLFFIYPLGMSWLQHYASSLLFLMVLTSIPLLLQGKLKPTRDQIIIVVGMFIFLCSLLLSFANAEEYYRGFKSLGNVSYLLLLLPLFWGAANCRHDLGRFFFFGLLLAAPINLGIALYSVLVQGLPRAKGYYNPIIFGDLALLSAMLLLCWISFLNLKKFIFLHVLSWLAIFAYLLSGLMSGTRGAFLVIPPVICLLVWFHWNKKTLRNLSLISSVTLLMVLLTAGSIFFSLQLGTDGVMQRSNVSSLFDPIEFDTAVSNNARLQMWKHSVDIFLENPLIGTGLGDYYSEMIRKEQSGLIDSQHVFSHAHNIYFHFLAVSGLLGLASLIFALFVLPFRFLHKTKENDHQTNMNTLAAMVFLVCFAVFGLTEHWFARSSMVSCFVVCMTSFLAVNSPGAIYEKNSSVSNGHYQK